MGGLWEGLRWMFCTRPKHAQGDASKLHWSQLPVQGAVTTSIEESKVHWSELPVEFTKSGTLAELKTQEKNRTSWEALQQLNPSFFQDWSKKIEIGQLIAEGGQAQIYEATWKMEAQTSELLGMPKEMVVKVFKLEGCSVEDFTSQWPRVTSISKFVLEHQQQQGRYVASVYKPEYVCPIVGAYVLKEKRFAFLMQRYKCDLRTHIDSKMRDNGGHGPPFQTGKQKIILVCIAEGMRWLHQNGVLHRDLKASNVLVKEEEYFFSYVVSDYECSLSTIGTGFWRAPEVLQELRDRSGRKRDIWTKKSDVYSFGMLCFEVLSGGIPFAEFRSKKDWDEIIDHDRRPVFPDYVDPRLQEMVKRCWDRDPEKRPSFYNIGRLLGGKTAEEEKGDQDTDSSTN